jgi:hypothetical protein
VGSTQGEPREQLHTSSDAGYHDTPLDVDVEEVYQEEECHPLLLSILVKDSMT